MNPLDIKTSAQKLSGNCLSIYTDDEDTLLYSI